MNDYIVIVGLFSVCKKLLNNVVRRLKIVVMVEVRRVWFGGVVGYLLYWILLFGWCFMVIY